MEKIPESVSEQIKALLAPYAAPGKFLEVALIEKDAPVNSGPGKNLAVLDMFLWDYFTAERLLGANVPVKRNLARIRRLWENGRASGRSSVRTVRDLITAGLFHAVSQNRACFAIGDKTGRAIQKILKTDGLVCRW